MAIQNRRGIYSDFDPTKMVEGEFAIVQSGDPDTVDGKAVYVSTQTGSVERVALYKDVTQAVSTAIDEVTEDVIEDINECVAENVERAETAAENAESSAEEAAEILENKADIDGMYDELYAGNLISDKMQTDRTPYLFRKTAGGLSGIGERCYDTIIGASVGENQLIQNGNFASKSVWDVGTGTTYDVSGNVATVVQTVSDGFIKQTIPLIAGHKYFKTADCKFESGVRIGSNGNLPSATGNGNWQTLSIIANANATATEYLVFKGLSDSFPEGGTTFYLRNVMYKDLTAELGSSIADYIYSLESATAGAGIAKLRSWGFLKGYQAYNAGSIESVEVTGKKVRGFNAWDEEWELGVYANADGQSVSTATNIRSKSTSYIPVIPNATYYFNTSGKLMEIYQYDANKNYISKSNVTNQTLTIDGNARYIRFDMASAYGTTYNSDICINLSSDRNGEYEPYASQTYALGNDTLNGIFKLDSNNELYADGDVKSADGVITRKYKKIVIDGNSNIRAGASGMPFIFEISDKKRLSNSSENPNGITDKLIGVTQASTWGTEYTFAFVAQNDNMYFKLSDSITTIEDAKTWLASNPITVVYEQSTPTTEQSTPFPSPQVCYPDGTEEYITSNGVPVGHETEYPYDLKGLVEGLIDVPDVPSTNGTYVLKATRSASGVAYSWVSE